MTAGKGLVRVLVVDDSALARAVLKQLLEMEGDIQVVGEAADGNEAVQAVLLHKPDLVTMDIDMPQMGGLEAIQNVMGKCAVPILVVTGERLGPGSDLGFRAIACGALDFTPKPSVFDEVAAAELRASVRQLSAVPVFTHLAGLWPLSSVPPPAAGSAALRARPLELVAIAAGAGGPRAVAAILQRLPANFRVPVVIAQHLPPQFSPAYARYLRSLTTLKIVAVTEPHECSAGEICIVGRDAHLVCTGDRMFAAVEEAPIQARRPSADRLFASVAEVYGSRAIGVLVSGCGSDGVKGLSSLHDRGGLTIAESSGSAMPNEMPNAAVAAGAVDRALAAELIADYLVARVSTEQERSTRPPLRPE